MESLRDIPIKVFELVALAEAVRPDKVGGGRRMPDVPKRPTEVGAGTTPAEPGPVQPDDVGGGPLSRLSSVFSIEVLTGRSVDTDTPVEEAPGGIRVTVDG